MAINLIKRFSYVDCLKLWVNPPRQIMNKNKILRFSYSFFTQLSDESHCARHKSGSQNSAQRPGQTHKRRPCALYNKVGQQRNDACVSDAQLGQNPQDRKQERSPWAATPLLTPTRPAITATPPPFPPGQQCQLYGQDAGYQGTSSRPTWTIGSSTVTDLNTGLTWMKSTTSRNDLGAGSQLRRPAAVIGGYDDWRLPTIKELYSLIEFFWLHRHQRQHVFAVSGYPLFQFFLRRHQRRRAGIDAQNGRPPATSAPP